MFVSEYGLIGFDVFWLGKLDRWYVKSVVGCCVY